MILKALNPTGTGKLALYETNYGTSYSPIHYLVFVLLGVAGGLWGGVFCKCNFLWSKSFRQFKIIKNNPVFEVFLVVLATALLQYPNPMTREPGDKIIRNLLQDCRTNKSTWICRNEAAGSPSEYYWLSHLRHSSSSSSSRSSLSVAKSPPASSSPPSMPAPSSAASSANSSLPSPPGSSPWSAPPPSSPASPA